MGFARLSDQVGEGLLGFRIIKFEGFPRLQVGTGTKRPFAGAREYHGPDFVVTIGQGQRVMDRRADGVALVLAVYGQPQHARLAVLQQLIRFRWLIHGISSGMAGSGIQL